MIISQDAVAQLADRIEHAYCRRHPQWLPIGVTPGVWSAAASRLLEAAEEDGQVPVDPEMFVAVQKGGRIRLDPWAELTQPRALKNYRGAIRRVVSQLRGELRAELRRGQIWLLRGESIDALVSGEATRISPLARYILAHRAGRLDLVMLSRPAARDQDHSCPLYRLASRSLLPVDLYPGSKGPASGPVEFGRKVAFSLN